VAVLKLIKVLQSLLLSLIYTMSPEFKISEFSVHIYAAVPANNYWHFIARYGPAISRLISKAI